MVKIRRILGIDFADGPASEVVEAGLIGGLVVVPSAPVLVMMEKDRGLADALIKSDLAVLDSGFLVVLWGVFRKERLTRVSGLKYLQLLLQRPEIRRPGSLVWILPSLEAHEKLKIWSKSSGVDATIYDCYIAPRYRGKCFEDPVLVAWLKKRDPEHIIICIGGGAQEPLGLYLRRTLGGKIGIHCIGAAIGFLTGDQVNIPWWADRCFLGWFFRICSDPVRFLPRYWRARRLVQLVYHFGEHSPGPE